MIKEIEDINYINSLSDYKVSIKNNKYLSDKERINAFTKILVYIDKDIVAFLDYSKMYENMEINYIFVKDDYRNQGIAYKLIKSIMNDYKSITLEVSIENIYAIKLYKSLGFKVIGVREKYYNGIDAYLMEVKNENFSDWIIMRWN